ncbi:MAG: hypothetical protein ACLP50_38045 [Solirubrobacteraceae bacterium]
MSAARIARRAALIVLVLALAAPMSALAQNSGGFFGLGQPSTQLAIPATLTGQLTVGFHGDPASGCAPRGLCGYSGTVAWRPPAGAQLVVLTYGRGATATREVELLGSTPNAAGENVGGQTTADVSQTASPGVSSSCLDATASGELLALPVRGERVTFTLAGAVPALLATRCAGPRDGDLVGLLRAPTLTLAAVGRGQTTISLAAAGPFSTGGFAGTIQSTIEIRLGRPGRTTHPPQGPRRRDRELTATYRAVLAGTDTERFAGDADPLLCAPLGSCGLAGSETLSPRVRDGVVRLLVVAPVSRPARDLEAAAGIGGGDWKGLTALGVLTWSSGGSDQADLAQGAEHCTDSLALGEGEILLITGNGRLEALYAPSVLDVAPVTRCPGPVLSAGSLGSLGSAEVPIADLARRTSTIPITTGSTFVDDGYSGAIVPKLTLTLARLSVRTRVVTLSADQL